MPNDPADAKSPADTKSPAGSNGPVGSDGPPDSKSPAGPAAKASADRARRITVQRRGPLLVEGPVEIELEDGTTVSSDRFRVALCTCRRSRRYPWCDTSHRRKA
ncbi:CDGSH iron-sulfur domain-containing protein [Streptomyces sp. NPDC017673]|uniref:CDGSH iron-sulfur domain-containing protein n=1 Tax=unclassified Streptomyces TaxID=2593676 RepID=UPI00378F2CF8